MANVDRVNGFKPVRHLNGSPYNGQCNEYSVPAADGTALFIGDLVKYTGTGDAEGRPGCIQAAAGDAVVGVIVGFAVDPTDLNSPQQYRVASTLRTVLVADSPDLILEAQTDGTTGVASIGLNADFVVAAGSTTTGMSGMEVDAGGTTAPASTATLPLKIIGHSRRTDNEPANANSKLLVTINKHQYKGHTGTAGA